MLIAGHVAMAAVGILLVLEVMSSAIRAMLLPRGVPVRVVQAVTLVLQVVFHLRAGTSPTYEKRDRIMATFGPVALLSTLVTWMSMIFVGFMLLYVALLGLPFVGAAELSGSSIFTLGTTAYHHLGGELLTYAEAGLGLLLLTLLITYMPSIYTAFSRRENGVALLRTRAGNPPRAVTMLIRYSRIAEGDRLSNVWEDVWRAWESWFTDIEETHSSFSILAFFRSPQPEESWVTAAGTVLDAASLWVSSIAHPRDPDAQLCIRAGFITLRRLASLYDLPFDSDPSPGDPITITRQEWEEAVEEMSDAGIPVRADRDAAWESFKGWRVNYDSVLLNLARMLEAPPTPWVSDRSPVGDHLTWTLKDAIHPTRNQKRKVD